MWSKGTYITLDNPNIAPLKNPRVPFGEHVEVLSLKDRMVGPQVKNTMGLKLSDMYLPDVTVRTMQGEFAENAVFVNQSNEGADLVASCLFLDGHMTTTLPGRSTGVTLTKGLQTLKYDPQNELSHWCPAFKPFHIVHLSINPSFIFGILPEDEKWSADLRERIVKKQMIMGNVPPALTMAQHRAIQDILHCPLDGKLGLLMMETSMLQLVLLLLHAQFNQPSQVVPKLATRDREVMHEVRDYLHQTFLEEHTLPEVARHFGINTNKLMTLFKRIFGATVFEYIHELKMDHAKLLLEEGICDVSETSRRVGYKNPHHFSVAFKKKHGVNPSLLKYS